MGSSEGRAERIEALQGLLERPCAPDLTQAEAKPPRTRLFDLLEQIDRGTKPAGGTSSQPFPRSPDGDEGLAN